MLAMPPVPIGPRSPYVLLSAPVFRRPRFSLTTLSATFVSRVAASPPMHCRLLPVPSKGVAYSPPLPEHQLRSISLYASVSITLVLLYHPRIVRLGRNALLVVVDRAVEVLDRAMVAHPQRRAHVLKHRNVVTDHQHTALELPQRRR